MLIRVKLTVKSQNDDDIKFKLKYLFYKII